MQQARCSHSHVLSIGELHQQLTLCMRELVADGVQVRPYACRHLCQLCLQVSAILQQAHTPALYDTVLNI